MASEASTVVTVALFRLPVCLLRTKYYVCVQLYTYISPRLGAAKGRPQVFGSIRLFERYAKASLPLAGGIEPKQLRVAHNLPFAHSNDEIKVPQVAMVLCRASSFRFG